MPARKKRNMQASERPAVKTSPPEKENIAGTGTTEETKAVDEATGTVFEDTATPEEKKGFNDAAAEIVQKPKTVVRAYCSRTGYNGWCDELVKPECHASQDKNGCKFGCPRVYLLSE